jgi:hypothetical protein
MAGKTGPCPGCKAVVEIPLETEVIPQNKTPSPYRKVGAVMGGLFLVEQAFGLVMGFNSTDSWVCWAVIAGIVFGIIALGERRKSKRR